MDIQIFSTSSHTTHNASLTFGSGEATIRAMVDRIKFRTTHLYHYGSRVKGVTITDAKGAAREIRGMISLLMSVCETPTLESELLEELAEALINAANNLRK